MTASDNCVTDEDLPGVDPQTSLLVNLAERHGASRLNLLPSESLLPRAVCSALERPCTPTGDPPCGRPRHARALEDLARQRCAACLATEAVPAGRIFVTVGLPSVRAAVGTTLGALLAPGATVMGMPRHLGGHLPAEGEFAPAGTPYTTVTHAVSASTGRLDYDAIMDAALEARPRLLIAGCPCYPWSLDWGRLREICDAVGDCLLLADVSHAAGLVAAGLYPNPVAQADVTLLATHGTLCGPPGAAIITADRDMAARLDRAAAAAGDDGPSLNRLAALAVTFHIAGTDAFRGRQEQTVANAGHLARALESLGAPPAYGGTDTHLCVARVDGLADPGGEALTGTLAAQMLHACGIAVQPTAVPGDTPGGPCSGLCMGTQWLTAHGLSGDQMAGIAEVIAGVLRRIRPCPAPARRTGRPECRIPLEVVQAAREATLRICRDASLPPPGEPAEEQEELPAAVSAALQEHPLFPCGDIGLLRIQGEHAPAFMQHLLTGDVSALGPGDSVHGFVLDETGHLLDDVLVLCSSGEDGPGHFLVTHAPCHGRITSWVCGLSEGWVLFDTEDPRRALPGPVMVTDQAAGDAAGGPEPDEARVEARRNAGLPTPPGEGVPVSGLDLYHAGHAARFHLTGGYFVGQRALERAVTPPAKDRTFRWEEPEQPLRRTILYEEHRKLTRKLAPFAGWEMPLWYTSISEEHAAVRAAAGVFDIGHMGCLEVSGPHAGSFLDAVTTNSVGALVVGGCQYSFLLSPAGLVLDDIIIYRRRPDRYLLVVNAANAEKVWAWLNAVNSREVILDESHPHREIDGVVALEDLGDEAAGDRRLSGLALQGPASEQVLRRLRDEPRTGGALSALRRFSFMEDRVADIPALISRTGYTGERNGYELYVHPEGVVRLWGLILEAGADLGVLPAGLGARDSTRIEAGLPLYGHELAGPHEISPSAAGYAPFVRLDKPFFVGRGALIQRDAEGGSRVVRFRVEHSRAHAVRPGDPVASRRGQVAGVVTSCAPVGGQQVGLAWVESKMAAEGTPILIYPARQLQKAASGETLKEPPAGAQLPLHEPAVVLPRFPA